jgi:thiamine-phosphate pyrophosphorylase
MSDERDESKPLPDVVLITDPRWSDDELAERAGRALAAVPRGSVGIQVRDKMRPARAVMALAERLRRVCREFGAPFYMNDRVDVALSLEAEGVHLGAGSIDVAEARQILGPRAFVSIAAHDAKDVVDAATNGATAALVSPIFATPGKAAPRGTSFISDAQSCSSGLRLYALGGVDTANTPACIRAGADGVAVIRAVWEPSDPGAAASALVDAVRRRRVT